MNFKAFQIKHYGNSPLLSKEIKLSLIVLLLLLLLHQSLINIGRVKVFESSGILNLMFCSNLFITKLVSKLCMKDSHYRI